MSNTSVDNVHIYKSNNLIESSYKLTIAEQRILYMGIKKLKPIFISKNLPIKDIQDLMKANVFDEIEITVAEYKKEFNIRSNNVYDDLVNVCNRLFERTIKYYDGKELIKKRWVITCKYNEENKSVKLKFHPELIMDLLIFKNKFTILRCDVTKSIKNSYTYRIYELLKQYEKIGKREFVIDDFRYILGIPDNEYPQYANMKQKIINPSIKALNKDTDIEVEFEEIKVKRKVVKLKFQIRPKQYIPKKVMYEQIALDILDNEDVEKTAYKQLTQILKMQVTPEQADVIFDIAIESISKHNLQVGVLDYIKEKNKVINIYKNNNEVKNIIGLLIKALQQNWQAKATKDSFNNFEQRAYNYEELENDLLGWNEVDNK